MSDMLRSFVEQALDERLREKYPHVQHPAGMYARVVRVKEDHGTCVCTVRLLDEAGNDNPRFPEIPGVKTGIALKEGDLAAVLLMYGGSSMFVIGRYEA